MCELAQKGVSSRAYRPGLYSKEESLLAAFDREYLRSMGDAPLTLTLSPLRGAREL